MKARQARQAGFFDSTGEDLPIFTGTAVIAHDRPPVAAGAAAGTQPTLTFACHTCRDTGLVSTGNGKPTYCWCKAGVSLRASSKPTTAEQARISDLLDRVMQYEEAEAAAQPPDPTNETAAGNSEPEPAAPLFTYKASDVDRKAAERAYQGTSFYYEKRGQGIIDSYMSDMQEIEEKMRPFVTDENRVEIASELERYRRGYLKRLNAYLAAHSRCLSTMITGPANFPVRRNQKANNSADKRMKEWADYSTKVFNKIVSKYDPRVIAARPINAGDDDAVERLQEKIAIAEAEQEKMKASNKIVRSKKLDEAGKIAALVEMGHSAAVAAELLKPDYCNRLGYAPFELTNNNANIRRMKGRLVEIETARAEAKANPVEDVVINGVTMSENTDLNRLQLFFDGKPDAEIRKDLKSHGFRWAPSQGAWQRQLTNDARWSARRILNRHNPN